VLVLPDLTSLHCGIPHQQPFRLLQLLMLGLGSSSVMADDGKQQALQRLGTNTFMWREATGLSAQLSPLPQIQKVKLAQMAASWAVLTLKIAQTAHHYIMECDKHAPFEKAPNLKPYLLDWALIHYMSSTLIIILTS